MCSYEEETDNILDFLKNGKECAIEFIDNGEKSKILTNCIIRNYAHRRGEIEVISNSKLHIFLPDNISGTQYLKYLVNTTS